MRMILIATTMAVALSGCQSTEQSMYEADSTCYRSGLRPGTYNYDRCRNEIYQNNRRKSDNTATLLTLGVAAAAIGGAAIAADRNDRKWRNRDRYRYDDYRYRRDSYYRRDGYRPYRGWY